MAQKPAVESLPLETEETRVAYRSQGHLQIAWRRLRRNTLAMVTLVLLISICAIAVAAPWVNEQIVGHDPNQGRLTQRFKGPSGEHRLGTDDFGRDVLARLIVAGRVSLSIGFMVAGVALTLGVSLGLMAAYYGRWVDDAINALIQIVRNIPTLFLLIMLAALFRPSVVGIALIFGALGWTSIARFVRGRVLSERA